MAADSVCSTFNVSSTLFRFSLHTTNSKLVHLVMTSETIHMIAASPDGIIASIGVTMSITSHGSAKLAVDVHQQEQLPSLVRQQVYAVLRLARRHRGPVLRREEVSQKNCRDEHAGVFIQNAAVEEPRRLRRVQNRPLHRPSDHDVVDQDVDEREHEHGNRDRLKDVLARVDIHLLNDLGIWSTLSARTVLVDAELWTLFALAVIGLPQFNDLVGVLYARLWLDGLVLIFELRGRLLALAVSQQPVLVANALLVLRVLALPTVPNRGAVDDDLACATLRTLTLQYLTHMTHASVCTRNA